MFIFRRAEGEVTRPGRHERTKDDERRYVKPFRHRIFEAPCMPENPGVFLFTSPDVLRFNLPMEIKSLRYRPTLDPDVIDKRLGRLFVPGPIDDWDLESRISRLAERSRVYAACSPHGVWAPGLALTQEMKGISEIYLPLDEIRHAFNRLFTLSLKFSPFLPASAVHTSTSWLDVLHRLQPLVREANPARLLRYLMADEEYRCRFLFALFLPHHYGGTFDRYPAQGALLRNWLTATRPEGVVRCLDAACGSGEGSYELAMLLLDRGYAPENLEVHGATVEPLELFAAAHGWFPHDPARQTAYRRRIRRLFADGTAERIVFYREDLVEGEGTAGEAYDVIICNGLLGGPLLNERKNLAGTVGCLCARLKPGGILLAADRFHGGWKRATPADMLRKMLVGNGLELRTVDEGVAGVKQGTVNR
jgi:chemotaxis methyl-accepting protein methylase